MVTTTIWFQLGDIVVFGCWLQLVDYEVSGYKSKSLVFLYTPDIRSKVGAGVFIWF